MEKNLTARVDVLKLDLSAPKSVRAFANQFNSMILPLNILINNAGVMFCSFQLSEDEVEMQFITSHRGIVSKTNCHQHMKQTISMADILIQGHMDNLSLQTFCT